MIKAILFFLYLAAILLSAVASIVFRRSLNRRKIAIMMPYLSLVFLMEAGLYIAMSYKAISDTVFVYNIYKIVTVLVFALLYYRIPFMAPFRRLILILTAGYLLVIAISYLSYASILGHNPYLTLLRGFLVTLFAILFLLRFFGLDNPEEEKFWRPLLWITAGVALFYPVISITASFSSFLSKHDATLFGFKLYQTIPQLMSIFMYSCFSYAFYLCHKKN